MPVLVWELTAKGARSTVETTRRFAFTVEELRHEAELLDRELDTVLDTTVAEVAKLEAGGAHVEFVRAWSIGSALRESDVLTGPPMRNEPRHLLWLALAQKCRTGIRSDERTDSRWEALRPSTAREPRREGRKLDYFEMCLWLAEQPFEEAVQTFGGSVRNVWQMLERPTLRPLVVRQAFREWLQQQDDDVRAELLTPGEFPELMKALRARWPDRGPGSAKRPVHYTEQQLTAEIAAVLDRFTP